MNKDSRIETFGFVATLLVVACHVDDLFPQEWQRGIVRWFGSAFSSGNVCNFFVLSGYFVAKSMLKGRSLFENLNKRIKTLLIPYLLWNIIVYLAQGGGFNFVNFLRALGAWPLSVPCDYPLWYIRNLFAYIVITPIVLPILRKSPCVIRFFVTGGYSMFLLLLFCDFKGILFINGPAFHWYGLLAFLIGASFAAHPIDVPLMHLRYRAVVAVICWILAATPLMFYEPGSTIWNAIRPALTYIEVASLFVFVDGIPWRVPSSWTHASFFIFAFHMPLLNLMAGLDWHLIPRNFSSFVYVAVFCVVLAVCMVTYSLIKKISPTLTSLLTGGRG